MALTAKVKDELLRATGGGLEVRAAEATALIRFGGELYPAERGVAIVAGFEEEAVARRLAGTLIDLCAVDPQVELVAPSSGNRESRFEVRVDDGAADVIRRLKLVTASGHPVVGMPRQVISGAMAGVEAAWRGAFLARGRLTEPGRTASLEVVCPGQEAALALVGLARRMGLTLSLIHI